MAAWPDRDALESRLRSTATVAPSVDAADLDRWLNAAKAAVVVRTVFAADGEISDDVAEATLLLATRLQRRKDSPEGVAGVGVDGAALHIARTDPDVVMLLKPYIRVRIGST